VACSVTIVAMEKQQYVPSLFVAGIDVVVNNINVFSAAMETTMDYLCTITDLQHFVYSNCMQYSECVTMP
jgi:hypothetical protein